MMRTYSYHLFIFSLLFLAIDAFIPILKTARLLSPQEAYRYGRSVVALAAHGREGGTTQMSCEPAHAWSRRDLATTTALLIASLWTATTTPAAAAYAVSTKVLVLGGTGFVGSQIVQLLREVDNGCTVVSTSRNGRDGTYALDVTQMTPKTVAATVQELAAGCVAVVSCIGAIGTDHDDLTINAATAAAAEGAKAAGVQRFVYITVAPEVQEFARDVKYLQDYLQGKSISRQAVLRLFGEQAILVEPTCTSKSCH